jgi:plastocyanin
LQESEIAIESSLQESEIAIESSLQESEIAIESSLQKELDSSLQESEIAIELTTLQSEISTPVPLQPVDNIIAIPSLMNNLLYLPSEIMGPQILECDPNVDPLCDQQQLEEECNDGQDNDNDGAADKSDEDCNEDCFDGIDNDDDGFIDDTDEDCGGGGNPRGNPGLPPSGSDNNNGDDDSSNQDRNTDSQSDKSSDLGGLLRTVSAESGPAIIPAEDVYESGVLRLDSDIKNLIILIPEAIDSISSKQSDLYSNLPGEVTIVEDTTVTWLNSDPSISHDLMIKEKNTGRLIFSDINIQYGKTSEFQFKNDGIYSYSYSGIPALNGIIKVVEKNSIDDNSLTSSSNPILGIGLVPSEQKDSIQERIEQKDYVISTFEFHNDTGNLKLQENSKEDFTYVMLVWAAKLFQ